MVVWLAASWWAWPRVSLTNRTERLRPRPASATCDYTLRDKLIREGDSVALFYPSANRDEEIFENPFDFLVDRKPNRHLGFGVGEHFCLGAHLARLEMHVAYKYLLPRIEEIELAGPVDRLHSGLVGGVKRLPIHYKLRPTA